MTIPGRNDPCPCDSGRKYKRCCWEKDHAAAPLRLVRDADDDAGTASSADWEVDLVALPIGLESDRSARPVAALIVSDHRVLHLGLIDHPPAGADGVAGILMHAIDHVTAEIDPGNRPRRITVRDEHLAAALRTRAGSLVVVAGAIAQLDHAVQSLVSHLAGQEHDHTPASSMARTWKGWGLSGEMIRGVFEAAARFYRAKPWRVLDNADVLRLTTSSGPWHVSVMGAAGEVFGLAMYERRSDIERLFIEAPTDDLRKRVEGMMVSLTFDRRDDLPPLMRREILAAGWPVASPDAYPSLMTLNTPGGGVTEEQAAALTTALRGSTEYAALLAKEPANVREMPTWRDAASGVTMVLEPLDGGGVGRDAPTVLSPALPQGAGASPEGALQERGAEELGRVGDAITKEFERAMVAAGQSASIARRDTDNARLLLEFLSSTEAIAVDAMTEYDLRIFLHDWCVRKVMAPRKMMRSFPVALKRFVAWLRSTCDLGMPWAAVILDDRERFEERMDSCPGGFIWDPAMQEWIADVTEDLLERVLMADGGLGAKDQWGEAMGAVEWRLHRELQRRWLTWRDAEIAAGVTDPGEVRRALIARQRAWEATPHAGVGGKTPVEAVRRERGR